MVPRSPLPPNPPAAAAKSSRRHCRHRLLPAPPYVTPSVTRQHGASIGCPALYGGRGALPVLEWQGRAARLWAALDPALRERLAAASLHDAVRLGCELLRTEEEEEAALVQLCLQTPTDKNPEASSWYREQGNREFKRGRYQAALRLYSKAASHQLPGSPEVSVCFANRSAALLHLGHFEACLEDIARAERHGYPDRLLPKVLLRKAECLLCLERLQDAQDILRVLESKIALDGVMTAHLTRLKKLSQLKVKLGEKERCPEPALEAHGGIQGEPEIWEENSSISGASSSLSLSFDAERGRHLVASQDIVPGQSLVKEEAFVSVLCPGESLPLQDGDTAWDTRATNADLYCHRCLRQLLASVPCQGCSYAKYCSQGCADMAWQQYHRTECSLGALLLTLGVFCHLALRTVLLAGFAEVSRLVAWSHHGDKNLRSPEARCKPLSEAAAAGAGSRGIPGCGSNGRYQSSYQALFHLLPHTEQHSPEHKFLCTLSVVAICKQLQAAGLEAAALNQESPQQRSKPKACGKTSDELSPELKTVAEAMLRHVLQLQCNAQAITVMQELGPGDGAVVDKKPVRLATAFFPVLSLLNHSCRPNTSVSFSGTAATVRASQPISSGQEVLHCYGPHWCRMRVADRQQLLSQYFFECHCRACLEELESGVKSVVSIRNSFCCPKCQAQMQGEDDTLCCSNEACATSASRDHLSGRLQDLQQQIKKALDLLRVGKADQAIKMLLKCQMDAGTFLSPEHLLMGEMEDHLAQVYATLGKWQEAARHLKKSIEIVEMHHGPSSVETGHELFKLAQILFNGFAVSEALSTIQRAEGILSVHFGPQSAQIQELQEMKACLSQLPRNILQRT
ncbi:PREDICTED: SET and MYND domain-containing protein 4 [Ficedula albicollis]|uniref:SET and MYND domain-containing protein 4 n=1 Tax=Ficedula albicollis TaxID=59894 RepID=UPI00035930CD|nr:PREDICTED: SET and MYND domain-containing protein 4 [Ficedula albicollis]